MASKYCSLFGFITVLACSVQTSSWTAPTPLTLFGLACSNPFTADQLTTDTFRTRDQAFHLDTLAEGLAIPWGLAFLPEGDMLITTLRGSLYRLDAQRQLHEIEGVPEVKDRGQGGLMDVERHPDFASNRYIYLTYSQPKPGTGGREATTVLMRARLENDRLLEPETLLEALPYSSTRRHYGSRIEFDRDGYLFLSIGERGNRDENPQTLENHLGKIHRLHDDGRIPDDNPFVDEPGAVASIWSYGHRNPQGLALHPETGELWSHEHGPRGGDEINLIQKGHNYGWPVISYGINYSGTSFTDKTAAPGMDQPLLYWDPSIAPCGMGFVTGERYPGWTGDLLIGSLKFEYLKRCVLRGQEVVEQENLMEGIGRVRQIKQGPDGFLYMAVEGPGAVYRLLPIDDTVR